jgi:alcohol dehydrogenase class IV
MAAFYLIFDMMRRCGLATKFSELKLDVDIDKLIQSVNTERFANNPVSLDEQKLKELIIHYIA